MDGIRQISLFEEVREQEDYLTEQIITYLGNKRALLSFIGTAIRHVQERTGKEKLDLADMFSGSGVVSRYFKQFADKLYVNDFEDYCRTINTCYLANRTDVDLQALEMHYDAIKAKLDHEPLVPGFISELYAPADDQHIQKGERAFFTTRNAAYIDTARQMIGTVPAPFQPFLLAPLLYEASVHNNTSGVFKGFYKNSQTGIGQFGGNGKNALQRILADIHLKMPVFSNFNCDVTVFQQDANRLAETLPRVDLAYMDPPYNQHPYGSNYFMLNLINNYVRPQEISRVSGIPTDWNKSQYNKKQTAKDSMQDLCSKLNARFLLVSFNSEGFISKEEMVEMLSAFGDVLVLDKAYNTFRGSRNLGSRDIHVNESLYLVEKS